MDAGNMLKPMLARGELRAIGATTLDEYRQHIEKDPALERRFQPVLVEEPSVEDTIAILRGLKERYEVHHGVRIQDPALVAAAVLSDRYVTGRFLPDKAIDLIDEAASPPADRDRLDADRDRRGRRGASSSSRSSAPRSRRRPTPPRRSGWSGWRRSSPTCASRLEGMKAHWQQEKERIGRIRALKSQIEDVAQRVRARRARRRPRARRRAPVRPVVELEKQLDGGERPRSRAPVRAEDAEGRGRPRRTSPRSSRNGPASRSRA